MLWITKTFNQLDSIELYQILKLRVDVFVVEQNCPYNELDNRDLETNALHLFASSNNQVVCYLRIFPPELTQSDSQPADSEHTESLLSDSKHTGAKLSSSTIGRVVINQDFRGQGLAHELLQRAIELTENRWPGHPCQLSAQQHLQKFYRQHGFSSVGEGYLEDGIPHIKMVRMPVDNT